VPGNPAHGVVVVDGTTAGSAAVYTCLVGYRLVGADTRTCLADNTWSGAPPTCALVSKHCLNKHSIV